MATIRRRSIFIIIIVGLLLIAVVPQLKSFQNSLGQLRNADLRWLILGILVTVTTYCLAAGIYKTLSLQRLHYSKTLLVQLATMFTNRLLPAGIGAAGLNFDYLRRQGAKPVEATGTIALNNILGSLGHLILLTLAVLFFAADNQFSRPAESGLQITADGWWIIGGVVVILSVIVAVVFRHYGQQVRHGVRQLRRQILVYRRQPQRLLIGLSLSMLLTVSYALVMWSVCQAVDVALSLPAAFFVLTGAVLGASLTPTPGGVGGAEASIVGVLALYNVDTSSGLAVALLYRLLTFWLPLLAGIGAFITARRKKYI